MGGFAFDGSKPVAWQGIARAGLSLRAESSRYDGAMPRFSLKRLLLAVTCIAISFGCFRALPHTFAPGVQYGTFFGVLDFAAIGLAGLMLGVAIWAIFIPSRRE